jgi:hypothetical protein
MTIKQVDLEQVLNFNQGANLSGSYLQTERHTQVSDKFQVIQPAAIGNAMNERGFSLVSCITGRSRHEDKKDFQRTIARYRSNDVFQIEGLSLDIIYISKQLGRGCDELRLGLYRGACANQWAVGTLFELIKFRHTGNPLEDIQTGIAAVLNQRTKLVETIQKMQNRILTVGEIEALAKKYSEIRLEDKSNVLKVDFRRLAQVRRKDDAFTDLFTVANVLQENVIRFPLAYDIQAHDGQGNPYVRHMTTRRLRESSSQLVDLNGKMFDAAMELVA